MLFAFVGAIGGPFVTVFGGQSSRHGSSAPLKLHFVFSRLDSDREEQLRAAVVLVTNGSACPGALARVEH